MNRFDWNPADGLPDPTMTAHVYCEGEHDRVFCPPCIAETLEYEELGEIAKTDPDPNRVRMALVAQGRMLFGFADDDVPE